MDIESSIVAAQNALVVNTPARQPEREAESRAQQQQRTQTELPAQQTVIRQASAEAYQRADQYRKDTRAGYDNPPLPVQSALDAYQSLERESRREEVRGLLGIDLYA
ncbi:hypothetical protein [Alteromonas flava]|uniref:hypothetical protein n=1 Tax=Alteromonas flava TaxID=2048003 RepID=UPI000C284A5E|nr:hypothetical protein [Alteromonas flava]